MKPHTVLDKEARELAALHSLSALEPIQSEAYVVHLRDCRMCRDEVERLSAPVQDMALLVARVAPSADLKARLMSRIRAEANEIPSRPADPPAQPWRGWPSSVGNPSFGVFRGAAAVWEPTAFAGVETRRLFVDPAMDRVTMLVRMKAGASYPSHRHAGPEECYVIEGDLRTGDVTMHQGDYKFSESGSLDAIQSTKDGCLLFLVSSMHDELIADTRL